MAEIIYSAQSATVRNAYREGADLLLLDGCSLPDICVACGNPALGNVERKEFSRSSPWFYALPLFLDLVAMLAFRNKFLFAFPSCPNCPPQRLRLRPVRLDRRLVVLRGASPARFRLASPATTRARCRKAPALASAKVPMAGRLTFSSRAQIPKTGQKIS